MAHLPMFSNDQRTEVVGLWSRRLDRAEDLAKATQTHAFAHLDELLDLCDAVSFAVPPAVQGDLALEVAKAGKAMLLDKPLAFDVDAARLLADTVGEHGVATQMMLSWRYTDSVRDLLAEVAAVAPVGGRGHLISGAGLGGPFATPWRMDGGLLHDLGPHVIDVLDAALGRVVGVRACGDLSRWVGLLLEHDTGLVSEVSLSSRSRAERAGVQVYTADGVIECDERVIFAGDFLDVVVDEFVATADGASHPLDVWRGLHLQEVIGAAIEDLR
jgi:predicted dehydrogenase